MATDPNAGIPPPPPAPRGAVTAIDVSAAQGFGSPPSAPPPSGSSLKGSEEKAAETITQDNNPGESLEQARERMLAERGQRLSLNAPSRKLEVPPIPGYHLHWFLERNLAKAIAGWYEYVDPKDVPTLNGSIGGRTEGSKSEDLGGSQVSQIAGVNEQGQPEKLILMKIRQEWYFEEQRKIAERNLSIIKQIFNKKTPIMAPEESQADYNQRYTREAVIDMSNGRFRKVD